MLKNNNVIFIRQKNIYINIYYNINNMIYRNQFFICNGLSDDKKNELDLKFIKLNSNRYLYYKNLNYKIFNLNENQIILIGFCIQSDPSKEQNLNDIFNDNIENIEIVLSTLVGNYIVIYKNMIYKDIGNLYKLFLYNNNNEILISNNALIFKNVLNLDLGTKQKFGGHKMRYCPGGKSAFSMVKSLYNSQNINVNGEIFHNKLLKDIILEKLTLNDFVKMHTEYCCQIISNLYKCLKYRNKRLFLTLTGGRDSRMILAVCLHLKIPFEEIITFKINQHDIDISKEICKKYNLKHTIIDFNKFKINTNIKKEWENIIGDEFVEKDNEIIQKEVLESIMNEGDCIIFGNGPEWCSLTYAAGCDDINSKEYSEYKKWIEKYHEEIPLKNRLFLEFRVGSWMSSIQHSYDMCSKIQRFCFPISEKIIANSFLLGSNRNKFAINEGVIKLLIPELNNIRYN
tara:strand:- start:256 stop:1626 length:1371 start_codon:yes stop_codon:yes gene_type:complete